MLIVFGCMLLAFGAPLAHAQEEIPTIRVFVHVDSAPLSFLDENKNPTGYISELLREAEKLGGFKLVLVPGWWKENLVAFDEGRIDVLANVTKQPEDEGRIDLTIPHVVYSGVVYYRPDRPALKRTADFRGKKLGALSGTVALSNANKHPEWGAEIVRYDTIQELIEATAKGECDGALFTSFLTQRVADSLGLKKVFVEDLKHRYHFAVRWGDRRTLYLLNEALATLKYNGTSDRLFSKWIGPIEPRAIRLVDIRPYFLPAALIVSFLAGVIWWQRRNLAQIARQAEALRLSQLELEATNQKLQTAIAEASRLADTARQANAAKSTFLATMSHEIRTPMNGVIGMTNLLLDSPLDSEQRLLANTVRQSAESLLTIINDVLDFSKIEAGQLKFEAAPFDLRDVVEGCLASLSERAHEKKIELVCSIPNDIPHLLVGDAVRLNQVLLNLLGNAVKFTERGEVIVEVSMLGEATGSAKLRFEIRDTGIGLSQEQKDRLFQPFVQADQSTARRFGGTGLGLAICKQLVGYMHGEIGVDSEPGKGSVFWFTAEFPLQTSAKRETQRRSGLAGVRTLLVEDNATSRDILVRQLEEWKLAVTAVSDGATALETLHAAAASKTPFALTIIDLHLPDMNGADLIRSIQVYPEIAPVRTVLLAAMSDMLSRDELSRTKIGRCLMKPVRMGQLLESIAALLDITPLHDEVVVDDKDAMQKLGLRVLVAEDNAVNQEVARMQLRKLGCRCDIAANGRAALEAAQQCNYDVVLMDCQMPEVDGFEAARNIRSWEADRKAKGETFKPLTIIAMTANAMIGDREACIKAGMNDYLAKPVRMPDLASILAKIAKPG